MFESICSLLYLFKALKPLVVLSTNYKVKQQIILSYEVTICSVDGVHELFLRLQFQSISELLGLTSLFMLQVTSPGTFG